MLKSEKISGLDRVDHGFFTRRGGVSKGICTSLNCGLGSDDVAAHIQENRRRVLKQMNAGEHELCTLYQVHSDIVVMVDGFWEAGSRPKGDALVTKRRNVVIGVLTADCAPVLLADEEAGVIAAAHAGWKGAKAGVLENTVKHMIELGANAGNIIAAIGPTIAQDSYEVGVDLLKQFPNEGQFFKPSAKENKYLFDLGGYVAHRLENVLNADKIENIKRDTLTDEGNFFSYRRACLAGERDYGRQISVIKKS